MDGIFNAAGGRFPTKKSLREEIGRQVTIEVTAYGSEGTTSAPGTYVIVGPDPYRRVWYARVTIGADGRLTHVDGKGAPRKKIPAPVLTSVIDDDTDPDGDFLR